MTSVSALIAVTALAAVTAAGNPCSFLI